jgi:hypothetical protein
MVFPPMATGIGGMLVVMHEFVIGGPVLVIGLILFILLPEQTEIVRLADSDRVKKNGGHVTEKS